MRLDLLWTVLPWSVLAVGALLALVAYRRGKLGIAVGILIILASVSRFGAPLAGSSVRLEQVAIIGLTGAILIHDRQAIGGLLRRTWVAAAAAAIYLATHVTASMFVAPEPTESLRIAAWLGVSMAGGAVVATLAFRAPGQVRLGPWIVGAALVQVAVALTAVLSQVILKTSWGVQSNDVLIGKAFGLSHEANLFGILLAVALPFAVVGEAYGGITVSRRSRFAIIAALSLGLGLAYSRGGLIAFGAATLTLAVFAAWKHRPRLRPALLTALAGGVILAGSFTIMQGQDALARAGVRDTTGLILVDVPAPQTPANASQTPQASIPSTAPQIVGTGDTSSVRLRSIRGALSGFIDQPVIGHGTDSYGQRHREITCRCPAHVSNLPVATLYEVGIVGSIALVLLVALVAVAAIRIEAYALVAAIVAMFVGYLFTDALRFAMSWILLGAAIGLAAAQGTGNRPAGDEMGSSELRAGSTLK